MFVEKERDIVLINKYFFALIPFIRKLDHSETITNFID